MGMGWRRWVDDLLTRGLESVGLFYSSYEGEVVDVDDPKGLGRVRIKCAKLWPTTGDGAPEEIWAWPKYGVTHTGGGWWWPPVVGDPVWVECRHGSPDHPVYTGGWWGTEDKPGDATANKRFLRTPNGWTVSFDDDSDNMVITNDDESGRITMQGDGRIDLYSGSVASWFTLLASGSLQHVTGGLHIPSGATNNRLRINSDGTIFIGPEDEMYELIRLLVELATAMATMTTPTAAGPQPPVNVLQFADIKTRLETLVAPMP